ncbi:MAG: hypothetical protein V4675_09890 [Verrucomicrobiota bacterium]
MPTSDLNSSEDISVIPRIKSPDWNGQKYHEEFETLDHSFLEAAVLWEYAREVEAICSLVQLHRDKLEPTAEEWKMGFISPDLLSALAKCKSWPDKAFRKSDERNDFIALRTPRQLPKLNGRTPLALRRSAPTPSSDNWGSSGVPGSSLGEIKTHGVYSWIKIHEQFDCDGSIPIPAIELHDFQISWVAIIHRDPLLLNIYRGEIDAYVLRGRAEQLRAAAHSPRPLKHIPDFREGALPPAECDGDDCGFVISSAYADLTTGTLHLADSNLAPNGSYSVWIIRWRDAVVAAQKNDLGLSFQRAYLYEHRPVSCWSYKELKEALRSLFAFRWARSGHDLIPLQLKIGNKAVGEKFFLSGIRGSGRATHEFGDLAPQIAAHIFPGILPTDQSPSSTSPLALITAASPHCLKRSGETIGYTEEVISDDD